MPISTITKMKCDWKGCDKVFLVPDDAPKLPPGTEEVIRTVDAFGNKRVFCTRVHLLKDTMEYIKATPEERTARRKSQIAETGSYPEKTTFTPSKKQLKVLADAGLIESRAGEAVAELETLPQAVPPAPENLNLEDETF